MKYYTTKEAAEFLGVSVRTLRRYIKNGKLPPPAITISRGDTFRGSSDMFSDNDLKIARLIENEPDKSSSGAGDILNYRGDTPAEKCAICPGMKVEKTDTKYQIQEKIPMKRIVPVDKLSGQLFNRPADEYKEIILTNAECGCVEGVDKKGKEIITPYWLQNVEGYVDLSPLNGFHREVLFALISAYEQGYRVATFTMTLRNLTGGEQERVRVEQFKAIKEAVEKLAQTFIKVDLSPLMEGFPKYGRNYTGKTRLGSPLLPCRYIETEINGQETLAIELLCESPLVVVARMKEQLLTYDATPIAIPIQNNTADVITIKNYLLRRIKLMTSSKRKRGLNTNILFETLFLNCGLADADKGKKRDVRKVIKDTLNAFKADGVIKDFEFERRDGVYRAISIAL